MSDRPRDATGDEYGDRPDEGVYDDDQNTGFFTPIGWPGWPSIGAAEEKPDEEAGDERRSSAASDIEDDQSGESGGWLSEGAIGLVILAGVVLFFFPEPATSGIGILLILVGLVAWVLNKVT